MKRIRRFAKTPIEFVERARHLLLTSDLSAQQCFELSGYKSGSSTTKLLRECRRYISQGRWVNQLTGELHPKACTVVCASEQVGLSPRTIKRRLDEGLIHSTPLSSHAQIRTFSPDAIAKLKAIGKKRIRTAKLSTKEVRRIRRMTAPASEIGKRYGISSKQVRRIRSGERWGWLQ